MNIKKLVITGAAAGLLLVSAAGAFASEHNSGTTLSNDASLHLKVNTSSNTGFNNLTGGSVKNSFIWTGDAMSIASVSNVVNSNNSNCGCGGKEHQSASLKLSNDATLHLTVNTSSNSGYNNLTATGGSSRGREEYSRGGSSVAGSNIQTGGAGSQSSVSNVVNSNVVGGGSSD